MLQSYSLPSSRAALEIPYLKQFKIETNRDSTIQIPDERLAEGHCQSNTRKPTGNSAITTANLSLASQGLQVLVWPLLRFQQGRVQPFHRKLDIAKTKAALAAVH